MLAVKEIEEKEEQAKQAQADLKIAKEKLVKLTEKESSPWTGEHSRYGSRLANIVKKYERDVHLGGAKALARMYPGNDRAKALKMAQREMRTFRRKVLDPDNIGDETVE